MAKRIIENFDRYHSMLVSKNEDFIKFALQELFEEYGKGYCLVGHQYRTLAKDLSKLVYSKSARIRKWVYHCACYCPEPKVIQGCLQKINSECKSDNILWCLSALSTTFTRENLEQKLSKQKVDEFRTNISPDIFEIASNLFSNFNSPTLTQDKIGSIVKHQQSTDKVFLTTVFGYPEISTRRKISDIVTESTIESLTFDDNPIVREYAYWALTLGYGTHQKRLLGDKNESNDIKKWIYANDITVLNNQQRFDIIGDILINASVQEIPIKVGILRGLEFVEYHGEYVNILISWLNHEIDPYIRRKLLERFVKYGVKNAIDENEKKGSYLTVLEDELNYGINSKELISNVQNVPEIYLDKIRHYWTVNSNITNNYGGTKKMEVFLGSSNESVNDMKDVGYLLEGLGCKVLPWNVAGEGIFPANENTIDSLLTIAERVNAAVFIFNADDITWHHSSLKTCKKVRDNVLFEYGLFTGKLGKKNVCFVCKGNPDLASDLSGVTYIDGDKPSITKEKKFQDWLNAM